MVAQGNNPIRPTPKFPLGSSVATPGALQALATAEAAANSLLLRHQAGDWGEVCDDDARANESALAGGERLLSAYTLVTGIKLWVITEADRSATTIMLPDEY